MRLPTTRYAKRFVRTTAIRRGVLGGDKLWLSVFALGLAGRQINKVLKRGDMPLRFSEKLEPGQSFLITHIAPEPRRRRRRR